MSNDVYKFDLCTDLLFAIPSLVMMPIYGSFCMGYFNQAGATLNSRKVCVANFRDFHPLIYSTEEELETNLSFEGSVNVTDHFSTTMKLGFCLNFAIICYILLCFPMFFHRGDPVNTTCYIPYMFLVIKMFAGHNSAPGTRF